MKAEIYKYYSEKEVRPFTSDILGSRCWKMPIYKKKSIEEKLVQLVNHRYWMEYYRHYLKEAGMPIELHEDLEVVGVTVRGGFSLDGVFADFHPLSSQEWYSVLSKDETNEFVPVLNSQLALMIANAAVNSFIRGLDSNTVRIVVFNRNNQYYRVLKITGNLQPFLEQGQWRLFQATDGGVGANVCSFCYYKTICNRNSVVRAETGITDPEVLEGFFNLVTIEEDANISMTVYNYLDSLNHVRSETHDDGWFHPSEIAITKCDRRLFYAAVQERKIGKISPWLRTVFNIGHCTHDVLQEAMTHYGYEIEVLAEDADANIHGSTDGIGEDFIVEIKSAGSSSMNKFINRGPTEAHIKQTSIYTELLNKKEVRYQYYNKNDGAIHEVVTPNMPSEYEFIRGRMLLIMEHVKTGSPPPMTETVSQCRECPYEKTVCRGAYE